MADSRKSDVNASSMIDLKAELFRKQEEFKRLKAAGSTDFVKGRKTEKHGKSDIFSRKNAGVSQRAQQDLCDKEEEDNVMDRSRRALEAKAKMYEKIQSRSGIPEEDGSEGYLVDFQKKAIDRIVEERRKGETEPSQSEKDEGEQSDDDNISNEPVLPPSNPDEEWVDYVDSFGRSRRCMKKDLPYLEKQERPLGKCANNLGLKLSSDDSRTLLSDDMRRELRRQQWEKEAEEAAKGPIHYANVQFDEIRTHGVGYYQFSKDSNLREEQMVTLNKLREQTVEERMRSERIKEKRKAALEARLAKVKQRRKMKGGSLLGTEDSEEAGDTEDTPKEEKKTEPEPLTRDESLRQGAPVREWDKGKEKMPEWNVKRYTEERRSERPEEFAPPQLYYEPQHLSGKPVHTQLSGPKKSSDIEQHTEAVLRQMRHSAGDHGKEASKMASATLWPRPAPVREGQGQSMAKDSKRSDVKMESGDLDLTGIPLPSSSIPLPVVKSEFTDARSDAGNRKPGDGVSGADPSMWSSSQSGVAVGQAALERMPACGPPAPDISVPPPGWNVPPQHPPDAPHYQQPLSHTPSYSHEAPSYTPSYSQDTTKLTSIHTQEMRNPASQYGVDQPQPTSNLPLFIYPSQQGLLSTEQASHPNQKRSFPKTSAAGSAAQKLNLVDKRFMQNRELPIDDMIGEIEDESKDLLSQLKPVAYQPGIFSRSRTASTVTSVAEPQPQTEGTSTSARQAAAQTGSIIFDVPDYLQPAPGVEAKPYQPGSFMAAKEAAAQQAEENYKASRSKSQYSSQPVIYAKPEDFGTGSVGTAKGDQTVSEKKDHEGQMKEHVKDQTDEEVDKFLRELRSGN